MTRPRLAAPCPQANTKFKCHLSRELFQEYYALLQRKPVLVFAEPGAERQDSVRNGFQACLAFILQKRRDLL